MAWCSTQLSIFAVQPFAPVVEASTLVSYGDWIAPGDYHLHSRFRHAINYFGTGTLLSVVDESVGAGPLNIVVNDVDAWSAEYLVVRSDSLEISGLQFALDQASLYNSALVIPHHGSPGQLAANLCCFKNTLRDLASPQSLVFLLDGNEQAFGSRFRDLLQRRFVAAGRHVREGRFAEGAKEIKGLGWGLTPSGDDFIAGLLVALYVRRKVNREDTSAFIADIVSAAQTTNPFSQAFLRCVAQGRIFERLKQMILALFESSTARIESCITDLLRVGETSGADIAVGLVFGLESKW
jgi:hypothetical protein